MRTACTFQRVSISVSRLIPQHFGKRCVHITYVTDLSRRERQKLSGEASTLPQSTNPVHGNGPTTESTQVGEPPKALGLTIVKPFGESPDSKQLSNLVVHRAADFLSPDAEFIPIQAVECSPVIENPFKRKKKVGLIRRISAGRSDTMSLQSEAGMLGSMGKIIRRKGGCEARKISVLPDVTEHSWKTLETEAAGKRDTEKRDGLQRLAAALKEMKTSFEQRESDDTIQSADAKEKSRSPPAYLDVALDLISHLETTHSDPPRQVGTGTSGLSKTQKRPFSSLPHTNTVSKHVALQRSLQTTPVQRALYSSLNVPDTPRTTASVLPISPLEQKMKALQQKRIKRQPTWEEFEELSSNPWAVILAGSVRQDNASRVRTPTDLLIDFGLVSNPIDTDTYLMPTELADLKAFSDRLKSTKKRFTKTPNTDKRKGERVRISPYKFLVQELADSMKVWDSKTKASRSAPGAVMRRLVPTKWYTDTDKQKAYQSASKDYWAVKKEGGELDDTVAPRPKPPVDFTLLQWQTELHDRITNMMRQRIVIALDHIGNMHSKRITHSPGLNTCFTWPDDRFLPLASIDPKLSSAPLKEFWNDMGDIETAGAIIGTDPRQGNEKDPRPPIGILPEEEATAVPKWVAGGFFLHLGSPSSTLNALPYRDAMSNTDMGLTDADLTNSKYITPMITIAQGRHLPVFSLPAMLGPEFAETIVKVLRKHKNLYLHDTDIPESSELNNLNHLIFFPADIAPYKKGGQITLAHELWQLWRYLGGRDCLLPAKDDPVTQIDTNLLGDKKPSSVKGMMRIKKSLHGYVGLSDAAWDHLYELLELPRGRVKTSETH